MKKYLPFFIFITVSSAFLALQIVNKKFEVSAKPMVNSEMRLSVFSDFYKSSQVTYSDNSKQKLSDIKKDVVILSFWASWCIPCLEEMPTLIKLDHDYKNVRVIYINIDEPSSLKKAKKIVRRFKLSANQIIFDKKMKLAKIFGLNTVPFSVVFKNSKAMVFYNTSTDFTAESFIEKFDIKKK